MKSRKKWTSMHPAGYFAFCPLVHASNSQPTNYSIPNPPFLPRSSSRRRSISPHQFPNRRRSSFESSTTSSRSYAANLYKPEVRRGGTSSMAGGGAGADEAQRVKVVVPAGGATRGRRGSGSGGPVRAPPVRFRTASPSYIRLRRRNGVGAKLVDLEEDESAVTGKVVEAAGAGQDEVPGAEKVMETAAAGHDGAGQG